MARPKKNPRVKELEGRIKELNSKDASESLYEEITSARELTESQKDKLIVSVNVKINELEQAAVDRCVESGDKEGARKIIEQEKSKEEKEELEKQGGRIQDRVDSEERPDPKLHASVKKIENASLEDVMEYQKQGKLFGHNPKKGIAYVLTLLMLFVLPAIGMAGMTDEAVLGNDRWEVDSSGNLVPGADNVYSIGESAKKVKDMYMEGDMTFRDNLLANGRYGSDTLIMQSSSTPIGTTQLAYAVVQKRVGGSGGLDETDGGTRLDNGTPGQMITFVDILQESGGSWIITPDTTTGFTSVTLNAAGEFVTMLFIDDTVGWVVVGTNGVVA